MRTFIKILAGLAILATAVIYRTDVFGAIVQRPAVASSGSSYPTDYNNKESRDDKPRSF